MILVEMTQGRAMGRGGAEGHDFSPGTGFTGRSEAGEPVGTPGTPGHDKTPIVRWDVAPFQIVKSEFEVGTPTGRLVEQNKPRAS